MVGFNDFDIVALRQNARGHVQQLEHNIDTDTHVRREHHGNLLGGISDHQLGFAVKARRTDNNRHLVTTARREVIQRPLGPRKVDQAIGLDQPAIEIGAYGHPTRPHTDEFAGIPTDTVGTFLIDRRHQFHALGFEDGLDDHLPHAPAGAYHRNLHMSEPHAIPHATKETLLFDRRCNRSFLDRSEINLTHPALRLGTHVGFLRRGDIPGNPEKLAAFIEEHRELARLDLSGRTLLQPIQIVPTIGMEHISEHRRTKDKTHLILGHARLQLNNHILGEDIPLLNVDLVAVDEARNRRASGECGRQ